MPDGQGHPRPAGRPDVVLVFMDDLTHWAVSSAGPGWIRTPNLDRLAARGTPFTHAFNQGSWSGAVRVPARAMLLTGRTIFHARAAIAAESGGWVRAVAGPGARCGRLPDLLHRQVAQPGACPAPQLCRGRTARGRDAAPRALPGGAEDIPRQAPARWLARYPAAAVDLPPNFLPEHPFDQGDHFVRDELLAPFPRRRPFDCTGRSTPRSCRTRTSRSAGCWTR